MDSLSFSLNSTYTNLSSIISELKTFKNSIVEYLNSSNYLRLYTNVGEDVSRITKGTYFLSSVIMISSLMIIVSILIRSSSLKDIFYYINVLFSLILVGVCLLSIYFMVISGSIYASLGIKDRSIENETYFSDVSKKLGIYN